MTDLKERARELAEQALPCLRHNETGPWGAVCSCHGRPAIERAILTGMRESIEASVSVALRRVAEECADGTCEVCHDGRIMARDLRAILPEEK